MVVIEKEARLVRPFFRGRKLANTVSGAIFLQREGVCSSEGRGLGEASIGRGLGDTGLGTQHPEPSIGRGLEGPRGRGLGVAVGKGPRQQTLMLELPYRVSARKSPRQRALLLEVPQTEKARNPPSQIRALPPIRRCTNPFTITNFQKKFTQNHTL